MISTCPPLSAVHVATVCGHEEVARRLLQEPAVGKDLLIQEAVLDGHEQLVDDLVKRGADVNSVISSDGKTLLHQAASSGYDGTVSALLLAGANNKNAVESCDLNTPLYQAAGAGFVSTSVEILLPAGTDFRIRNPGNDLSAVDIAAILGKVPALKAILRHGVDVDYRNKLTGLIGAPHCRLVQPGGRHRCPFGSRG